MSNEKLEGHHDDFVLMSRTTRVVFIKSVFCLSNTEGKMHQRPSEPWTSGFEFVNLTSMPLNDALQQ